MKIPEKPRRGIFSPDISCRVCRKAGTVRRSQKRRELFLGGRVAGNYEGRDVAAGKKLDFFCGKSYNICVKIKNSGELVNNRLRGRCDLRPFNLMRIMPP